MKTFTIEEFEKKAFDLNLAIRTAREVMGMTLEHLKARPIEDESQPDLVCSETGLQVKEFEGFKFRSDGLYWSKRNKCWHGGSNHRQGYKFVSTKVRKNQLVHRIVATLFIPNDNPEYTVVNHKNRNPSDNRVDNLEWCSQRMNMHNTSNQSKYGVSIYKIPFGTFQVQISLNGKIESFGTHKTPEIAKSVRNAVFIKHGILIPD